MHGTDWQPFPSWQQPVQRKPWYTDSVWHGNTTISYKTRVKKNSNSFALVYTMQHKRWKFVFNQKRKNFSTHLFVFLLLLLLFLVYFKKKLFNGLLLLIFFYFRLYLLMLYLCVLWISGIQSSYNICTYLKTLLDSISTTFIHQDEFSFLAALLLFL